MSELKEDLDICCRFIAQLIGKCPPAMQKRAMQDILSSVGMTRKQARSAVATIPKNMHNEFGSDGDS